MLFSGQCRRMFWSSLVMLGLNFFCPDNSRLGPIELGASGPLFWSLDLLGKAKISALAEGKHSIPRILLSFIINIDPSILHLSQSTQSAPHLTRPISSFPAHQQEQSFSIQSLEIMAPAKQVSCCASPIPSRFPPLSY